MVTMGSFLQVPVALDPPQLVLQQTVEQVKKDLLLKRQQEQKMVMIGSLLQSFHQPQALVVMMAVTLTSLLQLPLSLLPHQEMMWRTQLLEWAANQREQQSVVVMMVPSPLDLAAVVKEMKTLHPQEELVSPPQLATSLPHLSLLLQWEMTARTQQLEWVVNRD